MSLKVGVRPIMRIICITIYLFIGWQLSNFYNLLGKISTEAMPTHVSSVPIDELFNNTVSLISYHCIKKSEVLLTKIY